MKRFCFWGVLSALFLLASCGDSAEERYDVLGIYPMLSGYHVIYADQVLDSVSVVSSKSWTTNLSAQWILMEDRYSTVTVPQYAIVQRTVLLNFTANTTGEVRYGEMTVDNKERKVERRFVQYPWLNIEVPAIAFTNWEKLENPTFALRAVKEATSARLLFTIYADEAKLSCDADWVEADETNFTAGAQTVNLTFESNETGSERVAEFKLTTDNNVTTVIKFTQEG